jgi:hypothetical protein
MINEKKKKVKFGDEDIYNMSNIPTKMRKNGKRTSVMFTQYDIL